MKMHCFPVAVVLSESTAAWNCPPRRQCWPSSRRAADTYGSELLGGRRLADDGAAGGGRGAARTAGELFPRPVRDRGGGGGAEQQRQRYEDRVEGEEHRGSRGWRCERSECERSEGEKSEGEKSECGRSEYEGAAESNSGSRGRHVFIATRRRRRRRRPRRCFFRFNWSILPPGRARRRIRTARRGA